MEIVCIGQSAYDITVPIQEPIMDNRKYRIESEFQCGGGPALNSACLCALWGAPVQLVSRIGKDEYGDKLLKILNGYGVQTNNLIQDDNIWTPYSYIFVNTETGNRTIFNRPGKFSDVEYIGDDFEPDVILSDGHEEKISIQMMKKYPNAFSIVDAGSCRESTMKVARHADYLVCSEDFVRQYTHKEIDMEDWESCKQIFAEVKSINKKVTVITLGEKGLLHEDQSGLQHMPVCSVKAVDTTGAGDIFHGAFAYGVYKRMPILENLKQSSIAAAISVQTLGGQTSIPKLQKVLDFRKKECK